jgi:hypothetical protein
MRSSIPPGAPPSDRSVDGPQSRHKEDRPPEKVTGRSLRPPRKSTLTPVLLFCVLDAGHCFAVSLFRDAESRELALQKRAQPKICRIHASP